MKLEIHNMAGHLIRRLNQISMSVFTERMKAEGQAITSVQFAAMNAIRANPGLDQARLAEIIAYDRATIGGVVDRLEAKGFVCREVSARDRRARVVTLTAEGEAVLARLIPVVRDFQDDILSGLDATERAQFLKLAQKAADSGNHLSRAPQVLERKG
ncbi:MarR family winged helix-turn-helix transcriptional regulator [Celeribacter indicus]|uniref:MarR family transcriptional regulator n=1 Tax=Celeribacter indicus TaxID=1208324 RepID=A0A0B5DZQ2_9RHOB|nr:MarR family transcriptional regulator [Celeribacter indicus]AJE46176.1 MarR family transcriptional regulator [Celeribacter indicus]SDW49093.1 transcriptional regulator, MarR family [Celeribacter indicus]